MNLSLEFGIPPSTNIMIAYCECEAVRLMRPLSIYWTSGVHFRLMVDAGSVMISAIRWVHPSSDPPSAGKAESSAAEATVVTLETEDHERDTES